jgi:hypothetical protein
MWAACMIYTEERNSTGMVTKAALLLCSQVSSSTVEKEGHEVHLTQSLPTSTIVSE